MVEGSKGSSEGYVLPCDDPEYVCPKSEGCSALKLRDKVGNAFTDSVAVTDGVKISAESGVAMVELIEDGPTHIMSKSAYEAKLLAACNVLS